MTSPFGVVHAQPPTPLPASALNPALTRLILARITPSRTPNHASMTTPSAAPANPEKRRRYDRQFCIMFRPTGTLSRAAPLAPTIPDPPPRRKVSRILGLTLPPSTLVDDLCSKLVEKSSHWALVVLKAPYDPEALRIPVTADDARIERVFEISRVPRGEVLERAEETGEEDAERGLFEGRVERGESSSAGQKGKAKETWGTRMWKAPEQTEEGNAESDLLEGPVEREQSSSAGQKDKAKETWGTRMWKAPEHTGEGNAERGLFEGGVERGESSVTAQKGKEKEKWGKGMWKAKEKGKETESKKETQRVTELGTKRKAKCTGERAQEPRYTRAPAPEDSSEDDRHEDDEGFPVVNEKGKYLKMQVSEKPRFDFAELQFDHLGGPLWEILTGIQARTKFSNTELKHEAMRIWKRQQNYHLLDNNCQRFCILMAITIRARNHSLLRVLHGNTVKEQIKGMKFGGAKK